MNDLPAEDEQHDHDFIESLLASLYGTERERAQSLVTQGLDRLEGAESHAELHRPSPSGGFRWNTLGLVAVAMLVVVLISTYLQFPKSATAAVSQSLQVSLEDTGRHYLVTSRFRDSDLPSSSDLYVKGGDRYAVRAQGIFSGQVLWMGSCEKKAWVVPPIGPVLKGHANNLSSWVARRDDISTPFLHVSTVLERMRDSYKLVSIERQTLNVDGRAVNCHYVVGELEGPSSEQLPNRIELWSELDRGVAVQVNALWDQPTAISGRTAVSIMLKEEVALDDTFFLPESHGSQGRIVVDFGK